MFTKHRKKLMFKHSWMIVLMGMAILYCPKKNSPPEIPAIPKGPSGGATNVNYEIRTSSFDVDDDSFAIQFDWGDGNYSDWSEFVLDTPTVTMSHT